MKTVPESMIKGGKALADHKKMGKGFIIFQDKPPQYIEDDSLKGQRCATLYIAPKNGGTIQSHTIFANGRIHFNSMNMQPQPNEGIHSDIQTLEIIRAIHEELKRHA